MDTGSLWEEAKNTVALPSTLPSRSHVLQTCWGYGYVVASTAGPSAITLTIRSFNRAIILRKI